MTDLWAMFVIGFIVGGVCVLIAVKLAWPEMGW